MDGKRPFLAWLVLGIAATAALAQPTPDPNQWVSRKDHEALKTELEALKAKVAAIEEKGATRAETDEYFRTIDEEMSKIRVLTQTMQPGTTKFLFAGDIDTGFSNARGSNSSFDAGFGPLFLLKVNDRVLVEAGLDFGLSNDDTGQNAGTDVDLTLANITYKVCDYMVVGMGRFAMPFGIFHANLDPSWINKLPDAPLPFGDNGIAPDSGLGLFTRGAVPIRQMKMNYAAYVVNGPTLLADSADTAGTLDFGNFSDTNNNKVVGGRVGLLPIPELEVGYSLQGGRVNPNTFDQAVHALLQAVDLNYVKECARIKGKVTVQAEWVWSHVGAATFDPDKSLGFGPLKFDNDRNGGYVLVAYRPTQVRNTTLRDLEFVFRYDRLEIPSAVPGGGKEQRWAPGVVYWIAPNVAFKAAYELDQTEDKDSCALIVQFAVGL